MKTEYILELADQIASNIPGPHNISDQFILAYTEAIIRKCSDIATRNQDENMGWDIGEIIKEHFGLE